MQNINIIRNYILSRVFGLILLLLFVFTGISLLTFSPEDPFYGNWVSTNFINNKAGIWGSYFSGTIITFFSYSSYLFPVFFLIIGIKKIFGVATNFFIVHLVSLIISLLIFCFLLSFLNLNGGLLGQLLLNSYQNNFYFNNYFDILICILIFLIMVITLIYGLSLKIKAINALLQFVFKFV